jgi:hypothetical protein
VFQKILHDEGDAGVLGLSSPVRTSEERVCQLETAIGVWRDDDSKLLFVAELVTNSTNGQNHLRIFRILFDLGSQPVDV